MSSTLNEINKITEEPVFLTAVEVSEIFFKGKLKYARILQMTRNGELPAIKRGKSYLYLYSALEKWVEKSFSKPLWATNQRFKQK